MCLAALTCAYTDPLTLSRFKENIHIEQQEIYREVFSNIGRSLQHERGINPNLLFEFSLTPRR